MKPFVDEDAHRTVVEVIEHLQENFLDFQVSRTAVHHFMTTKCNLSLKQIDFHSEERNSPEKIKERYNWVRHWKKTDLDPETNCVFLDEFAFHINLRRSRGWSKRGTRAIVKTPKTRAETTTILGAISSSGLVNVSVRVPKAIKRQKANGDEYISTGTITGHYFSFLKATMDEMDRHEKHKNYYIVMDNAPIHINSDIETYIKWRGYRCANLPTYSAELNPIENFWAVAKSHVKRGRLLTRETLMTRIKQGCLKVKPSDYEGFTRHLPKIWEKCRNREPI